LEEINPRPEEEIEEPPPPEDAPELEDAPVRVLDPALLYFIILAFSLLGLNRIEPEIHYIAIWSVLTILAVLFIIGDKVSIAPPTFRDIVIGIGFGALVGLPLYAIGASQLKPISISIFKDASEPSIFQMLVFAMPLAESLYFRAAFQSARGPIFAGLAAGVWSLALFFPQLNVFQFPLVAFVIGLAFLFANVLYSYVRQRFGLYASWTCQIVINLLLLFAVRFV
jgi:hypothetical protein